jgi:hypothetical protein
MLLIMLKNNERWDFQGVYPYFSIPPFAPKSPPKSIPKERKISPFMLIPQKRRMQYLRDERLA